MPDDSHHQLLVRWRGVQLRAVGVPALLVVLLALLAFGRLAGAW
jgi:hypothetical protein